MVVEELRSLARLALKVAARRRASVAHVLGLVKRLVAETNPGEAKTTAT